MNLTGNALKSVRTKSQKLRNAIHLGKAKYPHVSVLVKAPDGVNTFLPMRTPRGQGATAKRDPQPNRGPIGRLRRAQQRLWRAAREEWVRAAV